MARHSGAMLLAVLVSLLAAACHVAGRSERFLATVTAAPPAFSCPAGLFTTGWKGNASSGPSGAAKGNTNGNGVANGQKVSVILLPNSNSVGGVVQSVKLLKVVKKSFKIVGVRKTAMTDSPNSLPLGGGPLSTGTFYMTVRTSEDNPDNDKNLLLRMSDAATWIQCGCKGKSCLPVAAGQTQYDPSAATATQLNCDDALCTGLSKYVKWPPYGTPKCTKQTGTTCPFNWKYNNGNTMSGTTVTDNMKVAGVWGNVAFGCSNNQKGNLLSGDVPANGYIGLGPSCDSILGQLSAQGQVAFAFSFCFDSATPDGSKFRLGRGPRPSSVWTAKLLGVDGTNPNYMVNIDHLVVGNKNSKPSMKLAKQRSIIEAGSYYTYLPMDTYSSVLDMIRRAMGRLPKDKFYFDFDIGLDCIKADPEEQPSFPAIVLYMKSYTRNAAKFQVNPNIYLAPGQNSMMQNVLCFIAAKHTAPHVIVGETWLQDKFVQVDVENRSMAWAPANCTSSRFF